MILPPSRTRRAPSCSTKNEPFALSPNTRSKSSTDMVSSGQKTSTFNIEDYLGTSRVMGFTMLVSVIDVILVTAIATLGAFLYNVCSALVGGLQLTLTDD